MQRVRGIARRASDAIERAVFGATVEEEAQRRADLLKRLIDARIDGAMNRLADALEADDEAERIAQAADEDDLDNAIAWQNTLYNDDPVTCYRCRRDVFTASDYYCDQCDCCEACCDCEDDEGDDA